MEGVASKILGRATLIIFSSFVCFVALDCTEVERIIIVTRPFVPPN